MFDASKVTKNLKLDRCEAEGGKKTVTTLLKEQSNKQLTLAILIDQCIDQPS